jgi:hypothetical protein
MLEPIWKRKGFESKAEYETNKTKKKQGIYTSMEELLAEEKGFKSLRAYQEHMAKQKGFKSLDDYQERVAKHKGFKSYAEYLEHLAKQKGFKSHSEYQKHLENLASRDPCELVNEIIDRNKKYVDPESLFQNLTSEQLKRITSCDPKKRKKI